METPTLRILSLNNQELAVWDWPGRNPALLFAHATGFHGRCWDQIARQFSGQRRIAVDFRGHGRSSKPDPPYEWPAFGADLESVARHLDIRDAIGVGHSMGGHSVVSAAIRRPEIFSALLLIDPTIFAPERYDGQSFDASFIRRRRAVWKSPEEMFERFRHRTPFAQWHPDVLRDYCEFGLLPHGAEFALACPPAVEASIYEHSKAPESNLYAGIPSVRQPVVVMRAGTVYKPGALDLSASPTAADLASKFPHGRDVLLPDHNHYIPMEAPGLVVEEIQRYF